MAYEKHTWETGEIITADKLNNIEDGIKNNIGYEITKERTILFEDEVIINSNSEAPYQTTQISLTAPLSLKMNLLLL